MSHAPFETHTDAYDEWYDAHAGAYRLERAALERALPDDFDAERALEVGVGTGRFAGTLGIGVGIDPARAPLERARERGVDPIRGVAELLPVGTGTLDLVAFVTVLSFVDDLERTLAEARRVLAADGTLVLAVLDRSSPIGQVYQKHKDESPFYARAEFLTADEASAALANAGFEIERRVQTIVDDPGAIGDDPDVSSGVRPGHGDGLFAVVRATPGDR
ncbi:class I SAM-dependent methyltransferase [Natrarchaeobius oligotrophus]|uniref:Class I SAM-dependent methyltransferase n=1 Tax=Natrarchaeobius chitinivorans TaxID=1679083 RepID=A0A3N6PHG7_NATCH|nr:class I SAM-dependent methyltransferase [Natrarchaeobius chitinivorans]RQG97485.1 class I SAM-dependent methyltransferase [Natrarchaeobius chitinivorans]